jgi:two-component system, LytTR family, response regulator
MSMLRSIIVDDEYKSRESLKILLEDFCENVSVDRLCQNVDEAILAINDIKPHVVFLDIQLQSETGFDLLTRLKNVDFDVIFTTAYSEYAIKAFKFSAIDYLLKPINIEELQHSLEKCSAKNSHNLSERLEQLIYNLKPMSSQKYKLALPSNDGLVFVKVEEILYCEADSNYTQIHLINDRKYLVSRTLKEYEELLKDQDFFRIHNSFLINLNLIKNYVRGEGGYVVMANGKSIDVSKRKKESFLSRLGH